MPFDQDTKGAWVLEMLCGQKSRINTAERSIAGFKIRQGHVNIVYSGLLCSKFEQLENDLFPMQGLLN